MDCASRGSKKADQDDAAGHLRPCHGLQLPLGEAEFVGGEVPDVRGGLQVEEQVRQVVQPVGGEDEQVDAAEDVPEGQALVPGLQIDSNLQPTEQCRCVSQMSGCFCCPANGQQKNPSRCFIKPSSDCSDVEHAQHFRR